MANAERKLRVLHVIASSRGGGAEHVRLLVRGLHGCDIESTVVMPPDDGNVRTSDLAPFARVIAWPLASGLSVAALAHLSDLIRCEHYDVLHCHGARGAMFARLAVLTLRRRPHVAFTIHGFAAPHYAPPRRQALLAIERLLGRATDAFVCVSEAEREAVLASGIAAAQCITVIHNGIAAERFARVREEREEGRRNLGIAPDAWVVTTICRLDRPRDFSTLLEAFGRLTQDLPAARLLIVGDGPLRQEVEDLVAAQALQDRVALLGMRHDVPQILGASDVLVLSSRGWEGLPLTVLEAQAAGLPVVASDTGGTREALLDGVTGWLYLAGDAAALAARLLDLAHDPQGAATMGERGAVFVREQMSAERMVTETIALYRRLVANRGPGGMG